MADAITVRNLVVCRGRRTILHDFSIGLPKGKVTAIIGPNGCGKSTFLKAVNGMIPRRRRFYLPRWPRRP